MAGLSILSQAAPIFQELGKLSATIAASLVVIVSVGNGTGRVAWAWISDLITRRAAFLVLFPLQGALFFFYQDIRSVALLAVETARRKARSQPGIHGRLVGPSRRQCCKPTHAATF
jgi:MFS family permease